MGSMQLPPLMEYFANIKDPRRETKNKKYLLVEVIVIAFLAVMSGADGSTKSRFKSGTEVKSIHMVSA